MGWSNLGHFYSYWGFIGNKGKSYIGVRWGFYSLVSYQPPESISAMVVRIIVATLPLFLLSLFLCLCFLLGFGAGDGDRMILRVEVGPGVQN